MKLSDEIRESEPFYETLAQIGGEDLVTIADKILYKNMRYGWQIQGKLLQTMNIDRDIIKYKILPCWIIFGTCGVSLYLFL